MKEKTREHDVSEYLLKIFRPGAGMAVGSLLPLLLLSPAGAVSADSITVVS